jgi:hypothetical protein
MKCIQPRDIAETVVYILSTPGYVQVYLNIAFHSNLKLDTNRLFNDYSTGP